MAVSFDDYLVIGISSRALFDLEKANEVFETQGLDAYREYQFQNENQILQPGSGFSLVKSLLDLNEKCGKKLVEVILMSRNSAETSLQIIHSLEHYNLDIKRMALSGGEPITKYLKPFGVDLFLSCHEVDVNQAIQEGFPAGLIYTNKNEYTNNPDGQIRIAFDADAVLFSKESEDIYQSKGLDAFVENEIKNREIQLKEGPMAKFLFSLSNLQKNAKDHNLLRTAIVTARDRDTGVRVIKTLKNWDIIVDEVFFLQGAKKADILESFGANIFFDDQDVHLAPASKKVPSARVPYKEDDYE